MNEDERMTLTFYVFSPSLRRAYQQVHLPDGVEGEERADLLQAVVREHYGNDAHRLHPHSRVGLSEVRVQLQAPSGYYYSYLIAE
jgi:hypothetical protein